MFKCKYGCWVNMDTWRIGLGWTRFLFLFLEWYLFWCQTFSRPQYHTYFHYITSLLFYILLVIQIRFTCLFFVIMLISQCNVTNFFMGVNTSVIWKPITSYISFFYKNILYDDWLTCAKIHSLAYRHLALNDNFIFQHPIASRNIALSASSVSKRSLSYGFYGCMKVKSGFLPFFFLQGFLKLMTSAACFIAPTDNCSVFFWAFGGSEASSTAPGVGGEWERGGKEEKSCASSYTRHIWGALWSVSSEKCNMLRVQGAARRVQPQGSKREAKPTSAVPMNTCTEAPQPPAHWWRLKKENLVAQDKV